MQFLVYQPAAIAHSFSLPVTFLPVLAALIGNDIANYAAEINTKRAPKTQQWAGRVDPRELHRIAGTLATCAAMPTETLAQVQDVVFAVLPRLLARPSNDPLIVANLATAAWSYRLDSLDAPHPTYPLHPRASDSPAQAAARSSYDAAYRSSRFSSFVLHVLKHGTVLLQGQVEMPEYQSPVVALGGPTRRWIYAVVREALGTGSFESAGMPAIVYEYARRGEALLPAQVDVPHLVGLLLENGADPNPFLAAPVLALPRATRFALVFTAVSFRPADPAVSAAVLQPPLVHHLPLLLALHHIQLVQGAKRPWSSHEILAAVFVSVLLDLAPTSIPVLIRTSRRGKPGLMAPRRTSMQRGVELVVTLVALNILAQVLLLLSPAPSAPTTTMGDSILGPTWTEPHYLYDGAAFHAFLEVDEATLWTVVAGCPVEVQAAVAGVLAALESSLGVPLMGR